MSLEATKQEFMKSFTELAMRVKDVKSVQFFGSFLEDRWIAGKSDIDIFIEGNVHPDDKKALRKEVQRLNAVFNLGLETACYLHPTPVFEDDKVIGAAFRALARGEKKDGLYGIYQKSMKKLCIPHKLAWKVLD